MIIIFDNCGNLFDNCDDWDVNNYNDYNDYDDVVKQPARVIGDDGDNHWNNFNDYNDYDDNLQGLSRWGKCPMRRGWLEWGQKQKTTRYIAPGGKEKYSWMAERNTVDRLGEIQLTDWEKYSWQTERNTVGKLREIYLIECEKYCWQTERNIVDGLRET